MCKNAFETATGYSLTLKSNVLPDRDSVDFDCEVIPRGLYEGSTYVMPAIPLSKLKLDVIAICSLLGISTDEWWMLVEAAPSDDPIRVVEPLKLNLPESTQYSLQDVVRFINKTSRLLLSA